MKLQLIQAPALPVSGIEGMAKGELGEAVVPPLALLYLAAQVRAEIPEIKIKITDGLLKGKEQASKEINEFGPDMIGISCATANATGGYDLARWIKAENSKALVMMGGVHPTSMIEDTLRRSQADFVIVGEGEKILVELVRRFLQTKSLKKKDYADIRGIAYLQGKKVKQNPLMPLITNLDSVPFPARDLVDVSDYRGWPVRKKTPEANVLSARGCPFNCHFCANRVWKLQKPYLRLRSPENVMDEVEDLVKRYGIKEYFEMADELNSSLDWAIALCQEKIKRKLSLPWKAQIRADKMNQELARAMAKSNCWYVHLGIESANQRTLDGVGKRITPDQVINCCQVLKKHGIKICGLFMLFNAWEKDNALEFEDVEATKNTLKFAERLIDRGLINNLGWSQATPYPGSALWDTALKYNLIPEKYMGKWEYWNHVWSFVMKLPGISEKERIMLKNQGAFLQVKCMIKNRYVQWNNLPYLMTRGLGLIKRLIWMRLKR